MSAVPAAAPAFVIGEGKLRLVPVQSDNMEPTLRRNRDYVLCVPIDHYDGEGIYVFDDFGSLRIFRCEARIGDSRPSIMLLNDNDRYPTRIVSRQWFEREAIGKVVADMKVRDDRLLHEGTDQPGTCSTGFASLHPTSCRRRRKLTRSVVAANF